MKVKIITDSVAYMTDEEQKKYDIDQVPLYINFEDI